MAILDILLEGDPRLRQKATRVRAVDASLRGLADDMFDTMMDAPGIGLAAPQIGVLRRLIWVHVPANYHEDGEPELSIALVNPEIVRAHGRALAYEGCLSIPGWTAEVPRAEVVTVKGLGLDNRPVRPARDRPPRRHPLPRPGRGQGDHHAGAGGGRLGRG
jgi:peptide deformylase